MDKVRALRKMLSQKVGNRGKYEKENYFIRTCCGYDITTVLSGVVSKDKNVSAAQAPKTLKMPIIIYDHLSDNLLFEYDLNNQFSNNLSLEI